VVYDIGVAVDHLLLTFANDLAAKGVRVGGVIQMPRTEPGCGPRAPMELFDLESGEAFPICQDLGGGADCCLDPSRLRDAAVRIRTATDSVADLVLVPRFGKQEARGQGFRDEIAHAVLSDRPVLTAVRRENVASWLVFTGVGTTLDARLWVLKDWWKDIAKSRLDPPAGHPCLGPRSSL
jgi:nucleoside-triphosphatase THEP1